jgi:aspartate/glutamate racemase
VNAYGPPLEERGFAYLVPDPDEVDDVMACIYDLKATSRTSRASQARLLRVAGAMRDRGAGSFLLACTELPLVVSSSSRRWPAPAIDPAVVAARHAILAAGARLVRP